MYEHDTSVDLKMLQRNYTNFVRASSPVECRDVATNIRTTLSGEEARRIYLEEIKNTAPTSTSLDRTKSAPLKPNCSVKSEITSKTDKDVFLTVQNNDIVTLRCILDIYPEKMDIVDDYGWSLLMIACQANAVDTAKELLERGIDMSIRDKAGNSARSLVIKNNNYILADILLNHGKKSQNESKLDNKVNLKEEFACDVCNKIFPDRDEHLSSTIHNISASRGKKIRASYSIPHTNRGFQIMLKVGWDRDSGLGRDGTGKIYPIKVAKKEDRKGLGHKKQKTEEPTVQDNVRHKNKKKLVKDYHNNRKFEINFRREFY